MAPKVPLIVVAAPSGAGKTSFVERICREDRRLCDVITCTTRAMRHGESQGHPYFFLSHKEFQSQIAAGAFVEWAHVHTQLYGTRSTELNKIWDEGLTGIMDVDVQGVRTLRARFPQSKSIFILPPSIEELRQRIIKRDGKPPVDLEVRLSNARKELEEAPLFNAQVLNDEFEASYGRFRKIVDGWLSER